MERPMFRIVSLVLRISFAAIVAIGLGCAAVPTGAAAGSLSTDWVEGFKNKARLLVGTSDRDANGKPYAALEISMPAGWKTYWRTPGDAGGIPPEFDWSGSENLASARVLYPAPKRLVDKSGTTFGYKDNVVFPIEVIAKSPSEPVRLKLAASYGVCNDICIPAEAALEIEVPVAGSVSSEISAAKARVPTTTAHPASDPVLADWSVETDKGQPRLVITVDDPHPGQTDVFVEGPDGLFVPVSVLVSSEGRRSVHHVALKDGAEPDVLKGKTLTVTLVGAKGQSETTIRME